MSSVSKVCFFFEKKESGLKDRNRLKKFIESMFRREKKSLASLNYIFCSDKRLLQLNREFLDHDYYTDIITFDLSKSKDIQAEIYISTDRVRENSKNLGSTLKIELHRVIFHGILHLCGYSDKTTREASQMREKEDLYLKLYIQ